MMALGRRLHAKIVYIMYMHLVEVAKAIVIEYSNSTFNIFHNVSLTYAACTEHHVDADVVLLYAVDETSCNAVHSDGTMSSLPAKNMAKVFAPRLAKHWCHLPKRYKTNRKTSAKSQNGLPKPGSPVTSEALVSCLAILQGPAWSSTHQRISLGGQNGERLPNRFVPKSWDFGTLNSESSSIWFTSNPQDRSDFAADTLVPNPSVADLL